MKTKRPDKHNADRATRAAVVLAVYTPGEDTSTGLRDLLADAMHLFGPARVRRAITTAAHHYQEEISK